MASPHYIIRARTEGSALDDFLTTIGADPGIELVDLIGPQGAPHTAVVAVPPERTAAFEQRFASSPHLLIERDRPLSLSPDAPVPQPEPERNTNA